MVVDSRKYETNVLFEIDKKTEMLQLYRVTVDPVEQVDLLVILGLGFLDQR